MCFEYGFTIFYVRKTYRVFNKLIKVLAKNITRSLFLKGFFFVCLRIIPSILNLPLVFVFKEIFISFVIILSLFVFSFFRKISIFFTSILMLFNFLFFRKILIRFKSLFLEPFFDNIHLTFYIL